MQPYFHNPIESFPIGNVPLDAHHAALSVEGLSLHPCAWIEPSELQAFLDSSADALVDPQGTALAQHGDRRSNLFPATKSFLITHPWDLLRANELHLGALEGDWEGLSELHAEGAIHPLAIIDGHVKIGPGTRLLPGVFIEGNVIIGADCKIGPNCYIRGNTSIGDRCHIGNAVEIKNSLILSGTNVGHLSYVGDSVLGERVNFGAGTITSNLRHDGANHRSAVDGELIDTGRRKFGCVAGDGVHTGINTSIYPGRKLASGTSTRPGEIIKSDIGHEILEQ